MEVSAQKFGDKVSARGWSAKRHDLTKYATHKSSKGEINTSHRLIICTSLKCDMPSGKTRNFTFSCWKCFKSFSSR